ncbi:MAG: TrkA family potassium uptake protein [Acidobacteriota bacterium]|nr:TrkA family potassium uptake protein [Acidobacteriota bacterium]
MKKIVIIGLGSFGINLVRTLSQEKDLEIVAVDLDEYRVNLVKDIVTRPVVMDGTRRANLETLGVGEMDCVVVSMGPKPEPSILAVYLLKELGAPRIIGKAISDDHEKILFLVGATEVSYPERDIARKIGFHIRYENTLNYLPIESGYVIQEIAPADSFVGKTLDKIQMRRKYNVTIIAVKSHVPEETFINPGADYVIRNSDNLLVFGSEEAVSRLHKQMNKGRSA